MQIQIEHLMGALGRMLDPNGPTVRIAQLSKAEQATLTKAGNILGALRDIWGGGDDNHPMDTDIAMAMYTIRQLVEDGGRIEI